MRWEDWRNDHSDLWGTLTPLGKERVPSQFKWFWFYLCWLKQRGRFIKQMSDIIWVVCYKLAAIWAPMKNCPFQDPQCNQSWQWLEEGCGRPVLGVCVHMHLLIPWMAGSNPVVDQCLESVYTCIYWFREWLGPTLWWVQFLVVSSPPPPPPPALHCSVSLPFCDKVNHTVWWVRYHQFWPQSAILCPSESYCVVSTIPIMTSVFQSVIKWVIPCGEYDTHSDLSLPFCDHVSHTVWWIWYPFWPQSSIPWPPPPPPWVGYLCWLLLVFYFVTEPPPPPPPWIQCSC